MHIPLRLKTLTCLLVVSFLFWGCSGFRSAVQRTPSQDARYIADLEARIAKNEADLADLAHRLAVIQFMVDDHDNMLRLGEKSGAAAP